MLNPEGTAAKPQMPVTNDVLGLSFDSILPPKKPETPPQDLKTTPEVTV